jgi:hypothetical protein
MNAADIAQKYLDQNFDWHNYDDDARKTLVNLIERIWQLGVVAGAAKHSNDPELNIVRGELQGIID